MDYSDMKATKVSKNKNTIGRNNQKSISKKDINNSKKTMKKLGISWIVVAVFIVVGLLGGYLVTMLITKNDTYEMLPYYGSNSIDVYIGPDEANQYYKEPGVKCIAFGKDVSKDYKVTYYYRTDLTEKEVKVDEVDSTKEGIYYAVYTSPSKKYSSVKLIRNIIVLKEEDNG